MTTTDLLIPASVAVVWLFGAAGRLVVRRRRAAVSSWDRHCEDAIRVARPARGDW